MTFPHEEFSASPNEPSEAPVSATTPAWWKPFAVPFASAMIAFAIGIAAALLWSARVPASPASEPSLPESAETVLVGSALDAPEHGTQEDTVVWEKEVYPNPSCPPALQNLVDPLAEYGVWSKCESYTLGNVKTGDYAGWLLSRYVMTMEQEMGGPTETSFLMLTEPSDVPRMVRLIETADQRMSLMNPIAFKVSEYETEDGMGLFEPINSALLAARVSTMRMSFPELDRFAEDRVMTSANALDGVRMTLRSLGTSGNGNTELSGDATRYFSANAVGTFEDGTLLAPSLDQRLMGAFIALRPDGRLQYYDALASIFHPDEQYGYIGAQGTVDVRWNDGTTPKLYIKSLRTGCGTSAPVDIVSRSAVGDLRVTGVTAFGNSVYEYISLPDSLTWTHESWTYQQPEGADTSVEAFMAIHPFFFWEDELGRLIRFTSSDAMSMAECGKPVIYLYPKTTMDVSVKLAPEGGFSKTEPAYGEGWNVTASPDGTLVNKADGKMYPYLFWEGTGGLYQSPLNFDVVARADVETYLNATLGTFGLNEKEMADFLEFWLPRMQDAPYYKIGWHGNAMMDRLAPMSLSVRPDSVIRILMDYEELDAPVAPRPQKFRTPERKGFTVVEWGGVLR